MQLLVPPVFVETNGKKTAPVYHPHHDDDDENDAVGEGKTSQETKHLAKSNCRSPW